ncbi:hypothetical protein ACWDBP_00435 [Streptomyces sp. NPDC001233]
MGGIWDKLTGGTKRPGPGVAPLPIQEVRAKLLALNGPDVRYLVRPGVPEEKADLAAECQIQQVGVTLKIRMRLIPEKHEVRVLEERWAKRSLQNSNGEYGRGHAPTVYRQFDFKRGPDGRRRKVETFRFDTREMTVPLQRAVLSAGWTWRGVLWL